MNDVGSPGWYATQFGTQKSYRAMLFGDSDSLACPYPDCLRYVDHHGPCEFPWGDSIPWPPEADWNDE